MKTALKIATLLLLGGLSLTVPAQELSQLPLVNTQSILNGKVNLTFPAVAQNRHRPVDIMAADPNINEETRIMIDTGGMLVVFFARELYTLADDKLLATLQASDAANQTISKQLVDKGGISAVLTTALAPESSDQTLVNRLMIRTPDHTLMQISVYINAAAYPELKNIQKLSERIFSTLTAGNRPAHLTARRDTVALIDEGKRLTVDLPANYDISIDQQYDFQVIRFHHYNLLGSDAWSDLFVYVGDHPHSVYADYGLKESDGHKVDGTFSGKKVEWLQFDVPSEKLVEREQKIQLASQDGLVYHVVMMGDNVQTLDDLTKLVQSMKVQPVK